MERLTWEDYNGGCYAQDILQQDYDTATVFTGEPIDRLAAYERTEHTPEECAAAFKELAAYRAADIWKIVCFMMARNAIKGALPENRLNVMALMTIKSMPDMLQMEECRKLLAAAEAALKEQEGQK